MDNVTCPFCGLACDDLVVDAPKGIPNVRANGCSLSIASFKRLEPSNAALPRIAGQTSDLANATATAAKILAKARNPLIAGYATDLSGARGVVQLADSCGATIDHMNSGAKFRNIRSVQDGGWVTTTLAEVKNRADLIVLVGTDVVSRFPRFFERVAWNKESMFGLDTAKREIVYLGKGLKTQAGIAPDGRKPDQIKCEIPQLGEAFNVMRALLAGRPVQADKVAGVPLNQWKTLLERVRKASYPVFVWAAPDLDFPQADLTVQAISALITEINNAQTRASGMPLGGSDGDFTANGVLVWQTGFPIRTSFARGVTDYDPHLNATSRLVESGEADALVWISSYNPLRTPPDTAIPTVVLAPPGTRFTREPEVFIPVGTPGLDHAGHFFRTDKVVALPLRQLRDIGLPSVADVATAIWSALSTSAAAERS